MSDWCCKEHGPYDGPNPTCPLCLAGPICPDLQAENAALRERVAFLELPRAGDSERLLEIGDLKQHLARCLEALSEDERSKLRI